MAFTPRSAKNAKVRVTVGTYTNIVYTAKKWVVKDSADKHDTTHFESGGKACNIPCIENLEFTIDADMDGAANPFDGPAASPQFKAGSIPTNIKLYLNDTTGPYWDITPGAIYEATHEADVKKAHGLNVRGEGSGAWVHPTGSF